MRRLRGFDSLENLPRALLLHVGWGWSLRETAARAEWAGMADVSGVALLNRLRQAEPRPRQLCHLLWKENGVDLQPAWDGRPVRLADAATVKEPGKTGSQWRLRDSPRRPSLECGHFELTSVRGKNAGGKLGRFRFHSGEPVLAGAG